MPPWTLVDTHPTQGSTFRRPLSLQELAFFWDGLFNGTADNIQHVELRLVHGARDAHLFSDASITRAWLSTKRRYPLVGASVQGIPPCSRMDLQIARQFASESDPHFVVREHDLARIGPREIVFEQVACAEEVQQRMMALLNGPRSLSEALLVQLYVFRETAGSGMAADVLHLVALFAHCVADGVAGNTFIRCLLDTLARGGAPGSEPAQIPLEGRLAMAVPAVELEPMHLRSLSPARRRWRRAVAAVILQLRVEKRQGGHTLPCRITRSTPFIPAQTNCVSTSLTHTETTNVMANCRLHGLTFGNAFLPLAQVAMTRVLCRRYLRGEISEEEWAYRRRQPYGRVGPLNMRPHLDKEWFERGGGGEFMISISMFIDRLPFMTVGATAEWYEHGKDDLEKIWPDGAPPFSELLTFDRFRHRAGLVQKQITALFGHPLFYEIAHASDALHLKASQFSALQWMQRVEAARSDADDKLGNEVEDEVLEASDIPMVWAHGGSSLGNMDLTFPIAYPLPPTHPLSPYSSKSHPARAGYADVPPSNTPFVSGGDDDITTPKVVVADSAGRLRVRPAELYLGAWTRHGQVDMFVYFDGNVFEESVVREWLEEVKGAVLWYLGRTRGAVASPSGAQDTSGGPGRNGREFGGVRATKL